MVGQRGWIVVQGAVVVHAWLAVKESKGFGSVKLKPRSRQSADWVLCKLGSYHQCSLCSVLVPSSTRCCGGIFRHRRHRYLCNVWGGDKCHHLSLLTAGRDLWRGVSLRSRWYLEMAVMTITNMRRRKWLWGLLIVHLVRAAKDFVRTDLSPLED